MEYGIIDIIKLLGSLAFFLYGMKLMSESLQKVAGDKMRSILSAITSNRFKGILTGVLITAIIQSSSATTVMLVSFVNAGLISLSQSIGVIMGANIGTTVTAWLISLIGFKVKMSVLVLPIMGLALPLIFSKDKKRSNWGSVIIGFAIIFIGLDFLKGSTPDIKNNPELMTFLAQFSNWGYWSIFIYLLIGTVLTMIIQSSSAVMALTLVMCFNGWISFEMAAAMVLGENIGTTITANLAALIANTTAKRTARAHMIFNTIGVIIVLIIFIPFLNMIAWITLKTGSPSPFEVNGQTAEQTSQAIPVALSIFHTSFNILITFTLVWFVPIIEKIVKVLVPQKEDDSEYSLKYISTGLLSTGEMSILQAKKETVVYAERIEKMFKFSKDLLEADNSKKRNKLLEKISKYEEISDNMEEEIASYLTRISEESISQHGSESISSILFIISHVESIGDFCNNIARAVERKIDKKIKFTSSVQKNLNNIAEMVETQLKDMIVNLSADNSIDFDNSISLNKKTSKLISKIRSEHFKSLKKRDYKCKDGIVYSDIYNELARISEYAFDISKSIHEGVSHE